MSTPNTFRTPGKFTRTFEQIAHRLTMHLNSRLTFRPREIENAFTTRTGKTFSWTVCATRGKTREGGRGRRLPDARSSNGKPGTDHSAVVRVAPGTIHIRYIRRIPR